MKKSIILLLFFLASVSVSLFSKGKDIIRCKSSDKTCYILIVNGEELHRRGTYTSGPIR